MVEQEAGRVERALQAALVRLEILGDRRYRAFQRGRHGTLSGELHRHDLGIRRLRGDSGEAGGRGLERTHPARNLVAEAQARRFVSFGNRLLEPLAEQSKRC